MKEKKLLITGSTGLIGTAIAYKAAENDFQLHFIITKILKKVRK